MILNSFQKQSLKQIRKSHLSPSDKIENFKEFLRSYDIFDGLDGYYTPKQLFNNFGDLPAYQAQLKPLKKYLNGNMLTSKHYYTVDATSHSIKSVTQNDVKHAEEQVIHILNHANI